MICFLLTCLAIVQQPAGGYMYVSNDYVVTQFQLGDAWYLAHNHLAGELFAQLEAGDVVMINADLYTVREVDAFVVSYSPGWYKLDGGYYYVSGDVRMRERDIANKYRHVPVLQTCIASDGNWSWGRLFVVLQKAKFSQEAK